MLLRVLSDDCFCYDMRFQILFMVLSCAGTADLVMITVSLESTKQF